jgi:hypothetical protein
MSGCARLMESPRCLDIIRRMTLSANSLNRFRLDELGGSARRAIVCPSGHKKFTLQYGPLDKPRKGANKNGIFAICVQCQASSRLTSGHIR